MSETLYAAFQTAVKNEFNVSEVIDGWITQAGYPVVTIQVSSDRKQVEVRQNRYLRNETIHHDQTQWKVPLNWASSIENTDFSYSKPMTILRNSSMKINFNKPIDWIVFNVQHSGSIPILSCLYCIDNIINDYYSMIRLLPGEL